MLRNNHLTGIPDRPVRNHGSYQSKGSGSARWTMIQYLGIYISPRVTGVLILVDRKQELYWNCYLLITSSF